MKLTKQGTGWEYSDLCKAAKQAGGPDEFINQEIGIGILIGVVSVALGKITHDLYRKAKTKPNNNKEYKTKKQN